MRIVTLSNETKQSILDDLLKRSPNNYSQYEATVNEIIDAVRTKKDQALFDYTLKFDKFTLSAENIKVTRAEIEEAYTQLDANLIEVIKNSAENIRAFHVKQLRKKACEIPENSCNTASQTQEVVPLVIDDMPLAKPQSVITESDSPLNEIALRLTVRGVTMEITNQATQTVIQNVISALRYSC